MKLGNLQVSFSHINNETTVCTVATSKRISTGIATKGTNDLFDKNIGRKLSLSRAIKHMDLIKDHRVEVWNDYKTQTKIPRW